MRFAICIGGARTTERRSADERGQLSAGTVFEGKCLSAIDAIAAVYRADAGIALDLAGQSRAPNARCWARQRSALLT
jgi:hypothetical protein